MRWRGIGGEAVGGIAAGAAVVGVLALITHFTAFDRRQFMADCTTARGSEDAGLRACAADWPRHLAAERRDWRVP